MYSDSVEVVENVEEIFLSALALLHSSDVDSADKLRKMLDMTIEKKTGKMSCRRLTSTTKNRYLTLYNYGKMKNCEILSEFEDQLRSMKKSQSKDYENREKSSSMTTEMHEMHSIGDRASRSSSDICYTDAEDHPEDEEIPRISIPDETTDDGIVCKVCNGDKLGPLVLLECQECQEAYHPLCHQPPVVDIDVYDPRIVWRCRKCIDMSGIEKNDGSLVVTIDDDDIEICRDVDKKIFNNNVESRGSIDDRRKIRKREENSPKKISRSSQKNGTNCRASSNLRKRVGSKLSVTRVSSANSCSVQLK